jgi:CBS domain-containing protein
MLFPSLQVLLAKVVADFGTGALYPEHLKLDGLVMVFGDKPPSALKKLTAADIMSKHTVRKLGVVDSVEHAWALVRDTRHNAFPVTDNELATLRSIIQKRRQSSAENTPPPSSLRRRNSGAALRGARMQSLSGTGGGGALEEESKSSPDDVALQPLSPLSKHAQGTGVFLGLIQRRHLIYVLTSMPCFPTATEARDSEPMTALPSELQLAQYAREQQARRSTKHNSQGSASASPDVLLPPNSGGSDGSVEVVSLDGSVVVPRSNSAGITGNGNGTGNTALSPLSVGDSPLSSPSAQSLMGSSPPPPPAPHSVSHALMHASGGAVPLLNPDGAASTSASFVEWCARQANTVGQDMNKVASGELTTITDSHKRGSSGHHGSSSSSSSRTVNAAAQAKTPTKHSRRSHMRPSSSLDNLRGAAGPDSESDRFSVVPPDSVRGGSSLADAHLHSVATPHTVRHSTSSYHGHNGDGSGGEQAQPLGADLSVQASMLNHFVNLSPFIDQGAYTVSEGISARRVWALFRALGMRHIVVLNHSHQPVGIITRGDLIRFAVAS